MITAAPPPEVLEAFGFAGAVVTAAPMGFINETFILFHPGSERRVVAQRVRSQPLAPRVHADIAAVTDHLAGRGIETPRLLRTRSGGLEVESAGELWRMLTHVDGETYQRVRSPQQAESAAALIARFHRALLDLDHAFAFVRVAVHDARAYIASLREALAGSEAGRPDEVRRLAADIFAAGDALERLSAIVETLPRRGAHGDLKIANVLFDRASPDRAICLIDFDTLCRQTLVAELGDALRCWSNREQRGGGSLEVREEIFAAAVGGYAAEGAGILSREEVETLVPAMEALCVGLAAHLCTIAVLDDDRLPWDRSCFKSLRDHALFSSRRELSLAAAIAARRAALEAVVRRALRPA